jgi:hypothetical protein
VTLTWRHPSDVVSGYAPSSIPAGVFEQVDLFGDRSEQLPQAIFFHFIEAKSLREFADVPDFVFSGLAYFVRRDRILHDDILLI